jgi:phosphoserine phosphatase RsbU/P
VLRFIRDCVRPRLALKLGLLVLLSTGLIFALTFRCSKRVARTLIRREVEANARELARGTVNQIEAVLRSVQPLPQLLAHHVASRNLTREELVELIEDELRASPHLYGGTVAYAPGQPGTETRLLAPYVFRKEGGLHYADLAAASYDYVLKDWYRRPRELGKPVWTDPYFDEGGGEAMMCTYAVPFYREINGVRTFAGVVGADIELEHLTRIVSTVKPYQSGYAFLLSQNGRVLSHPNQQYVYKESIFSLADEARDPQWHDIGQKMVRGAEGFVRVRSPNTGLISWLYYAPVSSGWSMGILFPEEAILADLQAMNRVTFWVGIVGLGLALVAIAVVSTSVTRPIRMLARQTREIARGNLELAVPPVATSDEVGDLASSFESMRRALKEYIANLAATTAAKERIESELKIARTIQRNFLPRRFPPFPDRTEFDLYAHVEAAKAVGGDLYDFFLLDEHHLFFSIGDVSGKGVPAALFMAVTKTLLKGVARQNLRPSEVLARVNQELFTDNEELMFVTLFCGVLDLRTGELQYTNAGHLPPLRLASATGATWVDLPPGCVLGIAPTDEYITKTLRLESMDTLLLYTDGVNEAMDPQQNLYGEARLQAFAASQIGVPPKDLVEALFASVRGFAGQEEKSDDITAMALQYRGNAGPLGPGIESGEVKQAFACSYEATLLHLPR